MALVTPPSWLQNGTYPAESDRLTQQALYNTTGIIGASSMAVTQNSPVGLSVRVAAGWAAIVGTTQSNMGTYVAYNDATEVLTVSAADPTNARIDRVVATVRDAYYSGSDNDVIFQVIAGTPGGSPVAPATPANSISLATIAVAANATQIVTANITDTRVATTSNLVMGKVLQVLVGETATEISNSSFGSHVNAGPSVTITPTSASSKFILIGNLAGISIQPGGVGGPAISVQLARTVGGVTTRSFNSQGLALSLVDTSPYQTLIGGQVGISGIDTPGVTAAITYTIQMAPSGSSGTVVYAQRFGIGTSALTVMEVAP